MRVLRTHRSLQRYATKDSSSRSRTGPGTDSNPALQMAISNKFSFTVRSILDLPENDTESIAHHSPVDSLSVSPYSSWTENEREHICKFLKHFTVNFMKNTFLNQRILKINRFIYSPIVSHFG